MVMVMSNCALEMIHTRGYSFEAAASVMTLHFTCMFAPGFFTGKLIEGYGAFLVAMTGSLIFTGAAVSFLSGTRLVNFYLGMCLLGLAWNFSFSAGTVMLTGSYKKTEAPAVQAVNDFFLFTVAGIGSLISGIIYNFWGWYVVIDVACGMMALNM